MALTLAPALSVKQKCLADTRGAHIQSLLRTFFQYWAQHRNNADIEFKPISGLETADVVLADVASRLLVLYLRKPPASTTDAWAKISDHATVASADPDVAVKLRGTAGGGYEFAQIYPVGLAFGTGQTIGSHTTNTGSVRSAAADATVGFAVVGAL